MADCLYYTFLLVSRHTAIQSRTSVYVHHGLINYVDTKAKCQHLKKLTCKGTLRQVFIRVYRLEIRVQWFWLFFTFWGITTHPWNPKGPRIWKLAKKNFKLHPWPAEIFGKNRKMRFFGMISKFNIRSPVWQIFTIFSACFIYGIPNTHIKF